MHFRIISSDTFRRVDCTEKKPIGSQRWLWHSVLGIPIPKSLAFWASPVGDAQNADRFNFA